MYFLVVTNFSFLFYGIWVNFSFFCIYCILIGIKILLCTILLCVCHFYFSIFSRFWKKAVDLQSAIHPELCFNEPLQPFCVSKPVAWFSETPKKSTRCQNFLQQYECWIFGGPKREKSSEEYARRFLLSRKIFLI